MVKVAVGEEVGAEVVPAAAGDTLGTLLKPAFPLDFAFEAIAKPTCPFDFLALDTVGEEVIVGNCVGRGDSVGEGEDVGDFDLPLPPLFLPAFPVFDTFPTTTGMSVSSSSSGTSRGKSSEVSN